MPTLDAPNLHDVADKATQVWARLCWCAGENSHSHQQSSQHGATRHSGKRGRIGNGKAASQLECGAHLVQTRSRHHARFAVPIREARLRPTTSAAWALPDQAGYFRMRHKPRSPAKRLE
jgi:hypothetical protein